MKTTKAIFLWIALFYGTGFTPLMATTNTSNKQSDTNAQTIMKIKTPPICDFFTTTNCIGTNGQMQY